MRHRDYARKFVNWRTNFTFFDPCSQAPPDEVMHTCQQHF
jgi:hypothetical protein